DWPQLNFIIYHSAYRFAGGGRVEDAWGQFEKTGRIEWVTDLAEIPSKYGGKPLGPADGPLKNAIFGETNARLYKYERRAALAGDRIAAMKTEYERAGAARSNLRYGYIAKAASGP